MRTITVYIVDEEQPDVHGGPKVNASVAPNGTLVVSRTVPNVLAGKTGSAQTEKVLAMYHPNQWRRYYLDDEG